MNGWEDLLAGFQSGWRAGLVLAVVWIGFAVLLCILNARRPREDE